VSNACNRFKFDKGNESFVRQKLILVVLDKILGFSKTRNLGFRNKT
jgi:hypothetical protein